MGANSSSRHDDDADESMSVFEAYDIGEAIGHGTFGEVRSCRRREDVSDSGEDECEEFAVKIVDQHSKQAQAVEAYASIFDEINILAGVNHSNIVELIDVFEDDRFLYVVMERVDGGELFNVISDRDALITEDDIARLSAQLLQALSYLHNNRIVHRDIKAQNILLTVPPRLPGQALRDADLKLIDFGLAAQLENCPSLRGDRQLDLVCGTPAMCAPEIWSTQTKAPTAWKELYGSGYGPKVDVYAAGTVFYLALLGTLPFKGKTPDELADNVCNPAILPTFASKGQHGSKFRVSPPCRQFLERLLEKDQALRPGAAEAAHDSWIQPLKKKKQNPQPGHEQPDNSLRGSRCCSC